jgi:hypothetical protein
MPTDTSIGNFIVDTYKVVNHIVCRKRDGPSQTEIEMLSRNIVDETLGPQFIVQSARDIIAFDAPGWVVTERFTGRMIWTGSDLTLAQAAERLLQPVS